MLKRSAITIAFLISVLMAPHFAFAASFVGPLQKNPYNQPNIIARQSSGALSIRNPQSGAYMSRYIPYYSSALYQAMKVRSTDNNLRTILRSIMLNPHVAEPGKMDKVVAKCSPDNKTCYQHVSLGYERARLFLMGYFYLVQTSGNQYAIKEAYCNKLYGPEEFKGKAQSPRPSFVPDNTVINVEHTWPQSRFTNQHPNDTQKSDLHHLFPTDSKLNAIRGNHPFGEVEQDSSVLKCGQSRFGVSQSIRGPVFEPPEVHKGRVARALFYFAVRYDLMIEPAQEAFLRSWHQSHPVDSEELLRNDEIYKVQGNRNPFIDHPELVTSMRDF